MYSKGWSIEILRPTGLDRIALGSFIVRIGSDPDNFLRLKSGPQAAPHHCQLEPFSAGFVIRDVSNGLGLKINGQLVEMAILRDSDRLEVADLTLIMRYQAPAAVPSPPARTAPTPSALPDDISELDRELAPPATVGSSATAPPVVPLPPDAPGSALAAYAGAHEAEAVQHHRHKNKRGVNLGPQWLILIVGLFVLLAFLFLLKFTLPSNQPRIEPPNALWRLYESPKPTVTPERDSL